MEVSGPHRQELVFGEQVEGGRKGPGASQELDAFTVLDGRGSLLSGKADGGG